MSALPLDPAGPAAAPMAELSLGLAELALRVPARVVDVRPPDPTMPRDHPLARRLIELGFIAGEPVELIARAAAGGSPVGVRIGGHGGAATFALRREEAAWIRVRPVARA